MSEPTLLTALQKRIADLEAENLELSRSLYRAENAHLILMNYYAEHKNKIDKLQKQLNRCESSVLIDN